MQDHICVKEAVSLLITNLPWFSISQISPVGKCLLTEFSLAAAQACILWVNMKLWWFFFSAVLQLYQHNYSATIMTFIPIYKISQSFNIWGFWHFLNNLIKNFNLEFIVWCYMIVLDTLEPESTKVWLSISKMKYPWVIQMSQNKSSAALFFFFFLMCWANYFN